MLQPHVFPNTVDVSESEEIKSNYGTSRYPIGSMSADLMELVSLSAK